MSKTKQASASYRECYGCSAGCEMFSKKCWGRVEYYPEHGHFCQGHKSFAGDVKRFTNWSGEYTDEEKTTKLDKHDGGWYKSMPSKKEQPQED